MSSLTHGNKYTRRLEEEFEKQQKKDKELEASLKVQEKSKNDDTTLAQQILILQYIGVLKGISPVKEKQAQFLSKLLNRGKEHIRRILINITEHENIQNLEAVNNIFKELKLNEITDKIEKDIAKVKK